MPLTLICYLANVKCDLKYKFRFFTFSNTYTGIVKGFFNGYGIGYDIGYAVYVISYDGRGV
jgi:hypothetical protein